MLYALPGKRAGGQRHIRSGAVKGKTLALPGQQPAWGRTGGDAIMTDDRRQPSPHHAIRVRGRVITAEDCARIIAAHPDIRKARFVILSVDGADMLSVRVELAAPADHGLVTALSDTVYKALKLRGKIDVIAPGSLPEDGVLIEDRRTARA